MSKINFHELMSDDSQENAEMLTGFQDQCMEESRSERLKLDEGQIENAQQFLIQNQAIINKLRADTSNPNWENFKDTEKQTALQVVIVAKLLLTHFAQITEAQAPLDLGNTEELLKNPQNILSDYDKLKKTILPMFNSFKVNTEKDPLILRTLGTNDKLNRTPQSIPKGGEFYIDFIHQPVAKKIKVKVKNAEGEEVEKEIIYVRVRSIKQGSRFKNVSAKGLYISLTHSASTIDLQTYDTNINRACSSAGMLTVETLDPQADSAVATGGIRSPKPTDGEQTRLTPEVEYEVEPLPDTTAQTQQTPDADQQSPAQTPESPLGKQVARAESRQDAPAFGEFELDNLDFDTTNTEQVIAMMQANPEQALKEIRDSIIEGSTWSEKPEYILKFLEMIKGKGGLDKIRTTLLMDLLKRGPYLALQNFDNLQLESGQILILGGHLKRYAKDDLEASDVSNFLTLVDQHYKTGYDGTRRTDAEITIAKEIQEIIIERGSSFIEDMPEGPIKNALLKEANKREQDLDDHLDNSAFDSINTYITRYPNNERVVKLFAEADFSKLRELLESERGLINKVGEKALVALVQRTDLTPDAYSQILRLGLTTQGTEIIKGGNISLERKERILSLLIKHKPQMVLNNGSKLLEFIPIKSKIYMEYATLINANLNSVDANKIPNQVLYHIARFNKTETGIFKEIFTIISKVRLIQPTGLNRNAISRQLTTQPPKMLYSLPIEKHLMNLKSLFPEGFDIEQANDPLKQLYILTQFKRPTREPYYEIGTDNIQGAKLLAKKGVVKLQTDNPESGLILIDRSKITTELIYNLLKEAHTEENKEIQETIPKIYELSRTITYTQKLSSTTTIEKEFIIPKSYTRESIKSADFYSTPPEFTFTDDKKFPIIPKDELESWAAFELKQLVETLQR